MIIVTAKVDGGKHRINPAVVTDYHARRLQGAFLNTRIGFLGGQSLEVEETPEEIDSLLQAINWEIAATIVRENNQEDF